MSFRMDEIISRLRAPEGHELAYTLEHGTEPTVVFLPGLRSDMAGAKATFLAAHCRRAGRAFLRFDYRGHGRSDGEFVDHVIGDWHADTMLVLDRLTPGAVILVGSSMGGWQALLAARRLGPRVQGLIGIAAAPDFTARLIEPALSPADRTMLEREGALRVPNAYGLPLTLTRRLLEDGRDHLVLEETIPIDCPVHLLHGQEDREVPWTTALDLAAHLRSKAVTVELVKDGDHRLSRPADLDRLGQAVDRVASASRLV